MMDKRSRGLMPSSPAVSGNHRFNSPPETPARSHSKASGGAQSVPHTPAGPSFRQVKLHASPGKPYPGEVSRGRDASRNQQRLSLSLNKNKSPPPSAPQTPRASAYPDIPAPIAMDNEDNDLSPLSNAANLSLAAESTAASEGFSGTKILLKASEMLHCEVKACELRMAAMLASERDAREFGCAQLRRDVEAMVTIVEALSSQVHKPAAPDDRLDAFLEQEKRARDVLREDVEGLADQISALEEERAKESSPASCEELRIRIDKECEKRASLCTAIRKDLDEERHDRSLSMAVLRKDLKSEMDSLASDLRKSSSNLDDSLMHQLLATQQSKVDATCDTLRNEISALSSQVQSMPRTDVVSKCTGSTGNSEYDSSGLMSVADVQHLFSTRFDKQKDDINEVQTLSEQLRLELAGTKQVVNQRLDKVDQRLDSLEYDLRASEALQRCLVDSVNLDSGDCG